MLLHLWLPFFAWAPLKWLQLPSRRLPLSNSAAFNRFKVKVGSKNVEKLILICSKFLDSLSWIIALRSKLEVVAFSLERKPWIIYSLSPPTEVSWWGCRKENMRQMRFWVQSIWQTSSSIFWVSLQINYTEALWNIIYCWEPARFCTKWIDSFYDSFDTKWFFQHPHIFLALQMLS